KAGCSCVLGRPDSFGSRAPLLPCLACFPLASRTATLTERTLMAYDFEEVQASAEANTPPPLDALRRLGEETEATQKAPQMSVGPNEGAFLRFVVSIMKPMRVL